MGSKETNLVMSIDFGKKNKLKGILLQDSLLYTL